MQKNNYLKEYLAHNSRALSSIGYFLILIIFFFIGAPDVMTRLNLHQSVFTMLPILIFIVLPLVFVVTTGEIDLSFASTFGLASYVFALLVKTGLDPFICFILGIISGALTGIAMGCLVVYGRVSSLIASLGAMFLIRGFILVLSNQRSITFMEVEEHWLRPLLVGKFYGFPMQIFWAALFTIFSYYLFRKHVFGIHVHHVGDNPESAAQMGINVNKVRITAFMYVGIGAALAGIFSSLINFTWWPTQGSGYLLLALAAVFVGGTPTWGGVGSILGGVFGVGIIQYMEVGIVSIGWSGLWRQFFNGLIIILAVLGHRFHGKRIR